MGSEGCAVGKDLACGDPGTPSRLTKPHEVKHHELESSSIRTYSWSKSAVLPLCSFDFKGFKILGLWSSASVNVFAGLNKLGVTEGKRTEAKVMKLRYARGRCFPSSRNPDERKTGKQYQDCRFAVVQGDESLVDHGT